MKCIVHVVGMRPRDTNPKANVVQTLAREFKCIESKCREGAV